MIAKSAIPLTSDLTPLLTLSCPLIELHLDCLGLQNHSQPVHDKGVLIEQASRLRKDVKLLAYLSDADQLVGDIAVSSTCGLVGAEAAVSVAPLVDDALVDGPSEFG